MVELLTRKQFITYNYGIISHAAVIYHALYGSGIMHYHIHNIDIHVIYQQKHLAGISTAVRSYVQDTLLLKCVKNVAIVICIQG